MDISKQLEDNLNRKGQKVVSSLANSRGSGTNSDRSNASQRLQTMFSLNAADAERLLDIMIEKLQRAELTINFKAHFLFNNATIPNRLENAYERNTDSRYYLSQREKKERELFEYPQFRNTLLSKLINGIKKASSGRHLDTAFYPMLRPKYGAAHFTGSPMGAASLYGKSYLVLRNHLKYQSTYLHGDSYGTPNVTRQMFADIHSLDRLIFNLSESKLTKLYAECGQPIATIPLLTRMDYIEVQIHAPINLDRDVARMHISTLELRQLPTYDEIVRNLRKFAMENQIVLEFHNNA